MRTKNKIYYSTHVKGTNAFNESLRTINKVGKRNIITPAVVLNENSGLEYPSTEQGAEIYKLKSVLFNNAVTIKKGVVKIENKYLSRLHNIEKLFIFLRRFEQRDMQKFMHVFEDAITVFVEGNRAEDVNMNFGRLHELQELVRIIIALVDEPSKICEDLKRISHADQFGIDIIH